ncbi:MAG: RNA polymerase sigma factor [Bacteroidales bacterium]|nr:RNA polymerase sigma factor [Bacteroidales bacterium]
MHLETFDKLYKQHYHELHRIAQKMLCYDTANDIVQDVFMDYYQKTKNGNTIEFPKSFLYRCTLNKCIDVQRKNKRFAGNHIPEETPDYKDDFEKHEARDCIRNCLAALDIKDRELVVLYTEGLSYKEMAEVTQIRFNSIGKTLSRALKKLEKEINIQGYELLK